MTQTMTHLQAFRITDAQHAHGTAGQHETDALVGGLEGGHHICWGRTPARASHCVHRRLSAYAAVCMQYAHSLGSHNCGSHSAGDALQQKMIATSSHAHAALRVDQDLCMQLVHLLAAGLLVIKAWNSTSSLHCSLRSAPNDGLPDPVTHHVLLHRSP